MTYDDKFKEKQKEEAVRRMISMGIIPHIIMDFIDYGTVYTSRDFGILYQLEEKEKAIVKRIEEKYDLLVYHVVESISYGYKMLTLFFVSEDTDEWIKDRIQLTMGRQYCYVFNFDNNKFSEFGSVGFLPANGGLVRNW